MRYWLPPRTSRSSSDWSRSTDCRYRFTSLALPAPHQMPPEPPISKRLTVSPAIFDASSTRAATSGTYTLRVSTVGASAGAPVALFHPDSIRTHVRIVPGAFSASVKVRCRNVDADTVAVVAPVAPAIGNIFSMTVVTLPTLGLAEDGLCVQPDGVVTVIVAWSMQEMPSATPWPVVVVTE